MKSPLFIKLSSQLTVDQFSSSLQKHRILHVVKWVSSIFSDNASRSSKPSLYVDGWLYPVRFFSTATDVVPRNVKHLDKLAKKEAQAALLDYLHCTRSLPFMDAEHMSKNSPKFSENLLKRVEIDEQDIGKAIRRFLRYHPVDEYEMFFESIGLKLSEYTSLLPRTSVFLHDDELLLENYHALWNYGIPRKQIGKFFKEAREIFGYDYGVLSKRVKSFEELGLGQALVAKILATSPRLLKESDNVGLADALRKLDEVGIPNEWLEQHLSEGDCYDWKVILELMNLLSKTGLSNEQLAGVIMQHDDLLLEQSGRVVFRLFGFLSKFGFTHGDMKNMFIQLPDISVLTFASNLCRCCDFLAGINMNCDDIVKIIRLYPILLGSCCLKSMNSLLNLLRCGTKRLCQMILDDPNVLKDWVKAGPLRKVPPSGRSNEASMLKTKFVLDLGFEENSEEMKRTYKLFRGRALELQERFDCLVDLGLSRKEVIGMVRLSPHFLKTVYNYQNGPKFSDNLLKRVESGDEDIGMAVRRLFFERIGLRLSEHTSLLQRSSVAVLDHELFLENCYALYHYGIPRNRMGMFFRGAREIFGYDYGVLSKKLNSYKKLGLRQSLVAKILMLNPRLLTEESANMEFVEALRQLDRIGIQYEWLEQHISKGDSYDWKVILELMSLLSKAGLSDEQLGEVIRKHGDILLEQCGRVLIRLFGFLCKFGFTRGDMKNIFIQLPDISVAKFTSNLCQCYEFLVRINMNCDDIDKIVRLYPILLGSCDLRKVGYLLRALHCGPKRLCQIILDDPNVLTEWVYGVEVQNPPLPRKIQYENVTMLKTKFLLNLGFKENSKEMEKALRVIRGESFQERFDCYVNLGLSREEVIKMVKMAPKILNASKELILRKIDAFVALGYSVSDLPSHPPIMCYTIERVKLRILVYQLLKKERGGVHTHRTLGTLLSPSDKKFLKNQVLWHPRGLEYWERLKKEVNSKT